MALAEHEIAMAIGYCVLMHARVRGVLCCCGFGLVTCGKRGARFKAAVAALRCATHIGVNLRVICSEGSVITCNYV